MDEVLQTCLCMEKPEMTLNGMELWGQEGTEVNRVTTSIRNWDKNTGTAKMCSQKEIVWKRKWKIEIVKEWYHSGIMIHNTLVSNAQINPSVFLRLIPSCTRVGHSANTPRLWHSLLSRRQLEEVWRVPRNKKKKKKGKWLEGLSYERILKYINTQHNLAKWQLSAQLTIYRHWKGIYRRMIEELQVSLKIAGKVMEETSHLDKGRGSFDNDILQAITFSQGGGVNNNESAEWSTRNGEEVA